MRIGQLPEIQKSVSESDIIEIESGVNSFKLSFIKLFNYIKAKLKLSTVAYSGEFNDLKNVPPLPTKGYIDLQDQKTLNTAVQHTNTREAVINEKISQLNDSLDDVAFSGEYSDLKNKPSLGDLAGKNEVDLNLGSFTTKVEFNQLNSSLHPVAKSGSYAELVGKPNLGDLSGKNESDLQLSKYATNSKVDELNDSLHPVAKSGDYGSLNNKPNLNVYATKTEVDQKDQSVLQQAKQYTDQSIVPPDLTGLATKDELQNARTALEEDIDNVQELLTFKVDKVVGKQLSTNDYDDDDKNKLDGIESEATKNQSDTYLLNRANHAGTQAINTIDGLSDALDEKANLGDLASSDEGKGAAMVGFIQSGVGAVARTGREKWQDIFDARDYGFDVINGSRTSNAQAIIDAVNAAGSGVVHVYADQDYQLGTVALTDQDVNIRFIGNGRAVKSTGSLLLSVDGSFLNIRPVSNIVFTTTTIDGSTGPTTRLTVADTSGYSRGDIVKVVSDDIYTPADKANRRAGEYATVVFVDGNFIYLSGRLALRSYYTTNVRVGIMPKRLFSVTGLKIRSAFDVQGTCISIRGLYRPTLEFDALDVGWIGLNITGCFEGEIYPSGNGLGTADGSLGYLVNDTSSYKTRIIRPKGAHWRHLTTTNHNSVDAGSTDLQLFGPTIDHTVVDGDAYACQGAPWDSHEGSIGTTWVRCSARGYVTNTSTAQAAFQLRGTDEKIIWPYIDNSFSFSFRVGGAASGEISVSGGNSYAGQVIDQAGSPAVRRIELNNFSQTAIDGPTLFGSGVSIPTIVNGGAYGFSGLSSSNDFGQVIAIGANSNYTLNDPLFFIRASVSSASDFSDYLRDLASL